MSQVPSLRLASIRDLFVKEMISHQRRGRKKKEISLRWTAKYMQRYTPPEIVYLYTITTG